MQQASGKEERSRSNSRPRPVTQVINESYELEMMSKLEETQPPVFLFNTTNQLIISPCVELPNRQKDEKND